MYACTYICRCEQCLQNRYGVIKAEADPSTWVCPVCNKNCNCSLCRKKVVVYMFMILAGMVGLLPFPPPPPPHTHTCTHTYNFPPDSYPVISLAQGSKGHPEIRIHPLNLSGLITLSCLKSACSREGDAL